MAINDFPMLSALRTKMQWHQERQRVLAENISNSDTPNFRPRELVEPKFDKNGVSAAAMGSLAMMQTLYPELEPPQHHRNALGFLCESPMAVDVLYTRIMAAGYESFREPWDAFWGQRYAVVLDPDGALIDLFAPLAAA